MSDVEYLKNEIVIMLKAGRSRSYIINQLKYEGHDEDKIKLIVDALEDELIKTKRKNLTKQKTLYLIIFLCSLSVNLYLFFGLQNVIILAYGFVGVMFWSLFKFFLTNKHSL